MNDPKGSLVLRVALCDTNSINAILPPIIKDAYRIKAEPEIPKINPTINPSFTSPKPSHFPLEKNQTAPKIRAIAGAATILLCQEAPNQDQPKTQYATS